MEGVRIFMKFLRVIKWIAFVVFILSFTLCCVGHGFVLCEMNVLEKKVPEKYTMTEIKNELASYDDVIKNIFGKDEDKKDEAQDDANATPDAPVFFSDEIENANVSDPVVATNSEADATTEEASVPADAEPVVTPEEPAEDPAADAPENTGYSIEGKNDIILHIMKYGTYSAHFGWITDHLDGIMPAIIEFVESFSSSEASAAPASTNALQSSGLKDASINVCMFVAYTALFITFILQLITKKHKTVYGYILMIIGFLFFSVFVLFGYYVFESLYTNFKGLESLDFSYYRFVFISACIFCGLLIGLPIYRCGSRQIANKKLKKFIASLKRRATQRKAKSES